MSVPVAGIDIVQYYHWQWDYHLGTAIKGDTCMLMLLTFDRHKFDELNPYGDVIW